MSDSPENRTTYRGTLAAAILRLGAVWIGAGALFKLFAGSPNDLPPLARDMFSATGLSVVDGFRVAIAIELCIVAAAFLRPRLAWLPQALLFGVFVAVLMPLVLDGTESCGCFGSSVTIPPIVMMGIDASLLALILATRPWSRLRSRSANPLILVPIAAVAFAAPWLQFKTNAPRPRVATAPQDPSAGAQRAGQRTTDSAALGPSDATPDAPTTEPVAEEDAALPVFAWFETDEWGGQLIYDIDLATYLPIELLPLDGEVVFYRQGCDHCQAHLEDMAANPPAGPLTLIRVPESSDTPENELTKVRPPAVELELPLLERGYGLETPSRLMLEGGIISSFEKIESDHDH